MSQTTQTLSWEEWRLWGQGYAWSTRYTASSVITVTRNIGSDTATVNVDTTMTTPSGDSSLGDWECIISINGASSGGGEKTFTVASAGYHAERSSYTVSQTYTVNVGVSAGTLSGQIKMRIGGYSGYQGEYSEAKAWSLTYDTKGTPSQATWSNAYFGNASTITIQRTVPDFRESVYLVWQDDTSHPVTIRTYSQSSATTISYTIPYNALPTTAQTRSAKIRVVSYNGSTQIGTWETSAVSVTVKSGDTTYLPTLSANPVAEAYNDVVSALGTDTAVAQYSKINVKANKSDVSLKYSATIVSRVVTFSNGSSASADQTNHISSLIQSAGDIAWTYTVTDSRGFKATRTGTYTVINSSAPSITSVTVYRGDSTGTAVDGGAYIYATATATCESLNGHNSVTLQGKVDSGSWQSMTNNTRKTLKSDADANTQYVVTLKATDLLRFTTMDFILPSADCPFHIPSGKHGMGIGMKAQSSDNTLYVGYDAKFYGDIIKHDSIKNEDVDILKTAELLVPYATEIVANKNLNTAEFVAIGRYYCPSYSTVVTLSNCPTYGEGFVMVVRNITSDYTDTASRTWMYLMREIYTLGGNRYVQYCQTGGSASWTFSDWKRIVTNGEVLGSGKNLNDYDYSRAGIYELQTGMSNAPLTWGCLVVGGHLGSHQLAFNYASGMFFRSKTGSPLAWTEWKQVTTNKLILDYHNNYGMTANTWVDTIAQDITESGYYMMEAWMTYSNSYPLGIAIYRLDGSNPVVYSMSAVDSSSADKNLGYSVSTARRYTSACVWLNSGIQIRVRCKGQQAGSNPVSLTINKLNM